jgi:hypothetical protein
MWGQGMDEQPAAVTARDRIAKQIIMFSGAGLVVISITVIAGAIILQNAAEAAETMRLVFNSLLPLFGTWVGTVIAYYFAKDNFEAAARGTRELMRQIAPSASLERMLVRDVMVPRAKMEVVQLAAGQSDRDINLKTSFIDRLKGGITRMPVLHANGAAKYIVHKSTLYQFVYDKLFPQLGMRTEFDPAAATLADLVSHPGIEEAIGKTLAFVPIDATLARAKEAMDMVAGCQDIFVTRTGDRNEPVEGWLTQTTIADAAKG